MKLFITGATGYIGQRLVDCALSHEHQVVASARRKVLDSSAVEWNVLDIYDCNSIELPQDIDVVVHLAANTSIDSAEDEIIEVRSAKLLLEAAKNVDAKFIFVSSQTAATDAPTAYGRVKWRIEEEVLKNGGWAVRPGQVYGGEEKGLFGILVQAVKRLPVLPAFLPSVKVQPIHVDDLVLGLLKLIERDIPSGVISLAAPKPVSFTFFLYAIAKYRLNTHRLFIPTPILLVDMGAKVVGSRLRGRLGLERLRSLFSLPLMDTSPDLSRLDLELRSLGDGMAKGQRRRLIYEAQTMLTYVLKERPSISTICRYVRAVEKLHGGGVLNLPNLMHKYPSMVAWVDDAALMQCDRTKDFKWRLDIATVIGEATQQGAKSFLGIGRKSSFLINLGWLIISVIKEIAWKLVRVLSNPFRCRYLCSWIQVK